MHLNSELLFRKFAKSFFENGQSVLEIGPAGFPSAYNKVINNQNIKWDTIDFIDTTFIESANEHLTHHLTDPYIFPIKDNFYDIVLSGQVIEHVGKVWLWLTELKRITKTGGLIIIINPVSWHYHEAPLDCWRIFPDGIRALSNEVGLETVLSLFESLEIEELQKIDKNIKVVPGRSYNTIETAQTLNSKIRWNQIIRRVPKFRDRFEIPIEVAFDTISILKNV